MKLRKRTCPFPCTRLPIMASNIRIGALSISTCCDLMQTGCHFGSKSLSWPPSLSGTNQRESKSYLKGCTQEGAILQPCTTVAAPGMPVTPKTGASRLATRNKHQSIQTIRALLNNASTIDGKLRYSQKLESSNFGGGGKLRTISRRNATQQHFNYVHNFQCKLTLHTKQTFYL